MTTHSKQAYPNPNIVTPADVNDGENGADGRNGNEHRQLGIDAPPG